MKKKLVFIIEQLTQGGAEVALLSLLNNLDYSKYDVDLFLVYHRGELFNSINKNVNILSECETFKLFDTSLKFALIKCIKNKNIKLLINRIKYSLIFKSKLSSIEKRRRGWKIISKSIGKINNNYDVAIGFVEGMSIRICVDNFVSDKKIGWIHSDYNKLGLDKETDKISFSKLDKIITVSNYCKRVLQEEFPEEKDKIEVKYNIVKSEQILRLSNEKILEDNFNNKFSIVTVGRLCLAKGYDIAVKACKILKDRGYCFNWYVIGEGSERDNIEQAIIENKLEDTFILLGLKTNPYPYIRNCDVYCQTSKYEGYGLSITEAKILKKPILVTNFSSAKEQIINNKNGLIVNIDELSVANGLEKLIKDKNLRLNLIDELNKENWNIKDQISKICEIF